MHPTPLDTAAMIAIEKKPSFFDEIKIQNLGIDLSKKPTQLERAKVFAKKLRDNALNTESKSLLVSTRSSPKTLDSISCASSMMSTGRMRVLEMCSPQRVRSVLKPAQRLCGGKGTPKTSPSSR
jgi:hypothetical protein